MKKSLLFLLAIFVIALMFSANALAQGDTTAYFVTYYSNNVSGAPDATIRLINDGDLAGTDEGGYLYPYFFVFDDSQELQECGYCEISPDGLLSEDVKTQLTSNTLTGKVPARGVIKIFEYNLNPGLHGWATHIERATATSGAYSTTEAQLADSNISEGEYFGLFELCEYAQELGSGKATITCTSEDNDF
jgi:hypothetical protein